MSTERLAHLDALINSPEIENFLRGVHLEAVHQVDRWGTANDRAKRPADWFWLVGYLAGKALHAQTSGNTDKALHHCISTAAALYNWHCSLSGRDVRMAPGSSDVALIVDAAFPGEAIAAPETSVAHIPALPISAEDEAVVDALVARRTKETFDAPRAQAFDVAGGTGSSSHSPEPWRCTICKNLNPDDATHCRQCDYSRMVMRDGTDVPRDGRL